MNFSIVPCNKTPQQPRFETSPIRGEEISGERASRQGRIQTCFARMFAIDRRAVCRKWARPIRSRRIEARQKTHLATTAAAGFLLRRSYESNAQSITPGRRCAIDRGALFACEPLAQRRACVVAGRVCSNSITSARNSANPKPLAKSPQLAAVPLFWFNPNWRAKERSGSAKVHVKSRPARPECAAA